MTATAAREGTDKEIVSELLHTSAWDIVLDIARRNAKSLKSKVFTEVDRSAIGEHIAAHNALKAFVAEVYVKGGEGMPRHVREIFE